MSELAKPAVEGGRTVMRLFGEDCPPEVTVQCPACASCWVHPTGGGTLSGTDPSEAVEAYPGTQRVGMTDARRSAIELRFACENCANDFRILFQEHKGMTFLRLRSFGDR